MVKQAASPDTGRVSDYRQELNGWIAALEQGSVEPAILKKVALFCRQHPVNEPMSPISPALSDPSSPTLHGKPTSSQATLKTDFWNQDKTFDRLFNALIQVLNPSTVSHSL